MKASFKQTVEIRAEIQREMPPRYPSYIAIPRTNLIGLVTRRVGCSDYAVLKQIKSLTDAAYLYSEKRGNKVYLFKTQKE